MSEEIKEDSTNGLTRYEIYVRVSGYCRVVVNAVDSEAARERAEDVVCEYDFGELKDIDWNAVSAFDEHGNHVNFSEKERGV